VPLLLLDSSPFRGTGRVTPRRRGQPSAPRGPPGRDGQCL